MNALIGNGKTINLEKLNGGAKMGITLLKEKIEEAIKEDKALVISISNSLMECRNTIFTEDYEVKEDGLYLNYGNFELHINLDNNTMVIKSDVFDEEFIINDNNSEIRLYFLD